MAMSMTPRKIYSLKNICCLCGFSFVVTEINKDGNVAVKKFSKLKLRLTEEKKKIIQEVTDIPGNAEGDCTKCYTKVEKVSKYRTEIASILETFELNMRRNIAKTPESRKKRLLRSPKMCLPEPKSIHLTNDPIDSNEKSKQGQAIPVSTCQLNFRPILPKLQESTQLQDVCSSVTFPETVSVEIPEGSQQCTREIAKDLNFDSRKKSTMHERNC
ncbi:uncharacterized protein LOC111115474 isoform X5 [Crassostrea virginica]